MAVVVVRCCCSSARIPSASSRFPPRSPKFALAAHSFRKWGFGPSKLEKYLSSIGDSHHGECNIHQILPACKSLRWKSNAAKTYNLEGDDCIANIPTKNYIFVPETDPQGVMGNCFPAMALLVANALMLIMPCEAFAETCEADNSILNMPLLLSVALIGAAVGGLLARQRRGELQRLNEQLRQINAALRRQAKIESYAPGLSYAPVGGRVPDKEVIVDPRKLELISHLKTGKNFLRNQELENAFTEFKTALKLARDLKDPLEEKKAARGLGASLQRQGKYGEAIKYHSMVLAISEREKDDSGNTEAYGAIADCYTELGDLERAGKFYDKYIARLETD